MDVKNILEKLRNVFSVATNKELSEKLGISYNTLNTWLKRNIVPFEIINKIVQDRQLSYDWLLDTSKTTISGNKVSGQLAGRDIIGHTNTRLNEIDDPQIAALAYGAYTTAKALGKTEELKKYLANAIPAIAQ